jgi:predicted dehydrogenase
MLNSEKLDAVHIATPHYLHADMTVSALQKDINVFLEKPICINNEQIDKLLIAEKNSRAR